MTAGCHLCAVYQRTCERCQRLDAIGVIVGTCDDWCPVARKTGTVNWLEPGPEMLRVLDAIAYLLIERARLVQQHRKDMRDEQREAQRGARESFDNGHDAGRRERSEW